MADMRPLTGAGRVIKRRKLSPKASQQQSPSQNKPNGANDGDVELEDTDEDEMEEERAKAENSTELPPVKGLDSSEYSVRRATLRAILEHLQERKSTLPLDSTQCLQLWRGFFVATYMHDSRNAISVQNLLRDLASTFPIISAKDDPPEDEDTDIPDAEQSHYNWLMIYHIAYQETLVREWAGIDSHRMNKYLLLVRFVLRELFTICLRPLSPVPIKSKKAQSKSMTTEQKMKKPEKPKGPEAGKPPRVPPREKALATTASVLQVMASVGPLNPSDRKIPDGLRLHVLDIWTDELLAAIVGLHLGIKDNNDTQEVLQAMNKPLETIAKSDSGAQRHIRTRAKETLQSFGEQLEALKEM